MSFLARYRICVLFDERQMLGMNVHLAQIQPAVSDGLTDESTMNASRRRYSKGFVSRGINPRCGAMQGTGRDTWLWDDSLQMYIHAIPSADLTAKSRLLRSKRS
jgi:hypothetical protein